MYQIGLLLLTGPLRVVVESISLYLKCCNRNVMKRLYIKLEPEFSKPCSTKSEVTHLRHLSDFIPLVYNRASSLCQNLDVRVILSDPKKIKPTSQFDVILTDSVEDDQNISSYISNNLKGTYSSIIKLDEEKLMHSEDSYKGLSLSNFEIYDTVCLGGTFDRLHNGHKVLLSEAVLRATKKLIVGVTDESMLKRKILCELIEPVQKRISDVTEFLLDVDPSLQYEVVAITDPYGPTITDPDIDCIVVSSETRIGGEKVNTERKIRGMSELSMYDVDLVENAHKIPGEEEKLSSSTRRMHLLGTCLKQPEPTSNDLYIIFLQGQPLTGKSCIMSNFKKRDGIVISCSDIIKSILEKEEERKTLLYQLNASVPNGAPIDYRKLVVTCLQEKEKRRWTASFLSKKVEEEIKQKLQFHQKQGVKLILIQDSLLLDGNLKCEINEVWSTIMPATEIEKRLNASYDLSEEVAKKAILSMPSNKEYLEKSHRVFCTLWSNEITEQQISRAWSEMKPKIQ